jgi:hypothetical protein
MEGLESQTFDNILVDDTMFASGGQRHAFAARIGRTWWAVVDGVLEGPYEEIKSLAPRDARPVRFAFSPDGFHVAYIARSGKAWHVVRDGRRSPGYGDVVALAFSPDSRHLVYRASSSDDRRLALTLSGFALLNVLISSWLVVVDDGDSILADGAEGWFDGTGFVFDSPREFHWVAIRYPYGAYVIRHDIQ